MQPFIRTKTYQMFVKIWTFERFLNLNLNVNVTNKLEFQSLKRVGLRYTADKNHEEILSQRLF